MAANVHDKNECGRSSVGNRGQFVFYSGELWNKLSGKVLFADVFCVVGREMVSRRAEGAHPQFGPEVNLTVRVQHCVTRLGRAAYWFVRKGSRRCRGLGKFRKRSVECSNGCNDASGFEAGAWPGVE